jgi:hypothetical protein
VVTISSRPPSTTTLTLSGTATITSLRRLASRRRKSSPSDDEHAACSFHLRSAFKASSHLCGICAARLCFSWRALRRNRSVETAPPTAIFVKHGTGSQDPIQYSLNLWESAYGMVTDQQVRRLFRLSNTEKTQEIAASKAGMDVKTARKYLRARVLQGSRDISGGRGRDVWRCCFSFGITCSPHIRTSSYEGCK